MRIIEDLYGSVSIEESKLWGANTQRSLANFAIGEETMPDKMIQALILIKKAAATANESVGVISSEKKAAIIKACDVLLHDEKMKEHFPLSVWQTGSGTQTNMNVNEVIANLANLLMEEALVHPNDDVNASQSTNDVFPTAMHISSVLMITEVLLPTMKRFKNTLHTLSLKNKDILKTGRTHLQDATPISFGQEISAWKFMIESNISQIEDALKYLQKLPIGGTAVGTGLNSFVGYGEKVCESLESMTGYGFEPSSNLFHAMSSKDMFVFAHGALNAAASNLFKIANDIRLLASGPRCGLGEITIPSNEAGSSIMPGKVNPTQAEALTMVCLQVMGNNTTIAMAASQGHFQLNAFMPLIMQNMTQSLRLLSDAMDSFHDKCLVGLVPNKEKMHENLTSSLMSATYLNKKFGYDTISRLVNEAHRDNIRIKDAVLKHQLMDKASFDEFFDYHEMIKAKEMKECAHETKTKPITSILKDTEEVDQRKKSF